MDAITIFDKIICDDSNLKKRICLINVLTVALFSCLGMICEFRHLKFFKLLLDRVNLLNQLYWYLWSYCKRRVLYINVCFEFCYFYFKQCVCKQCKDAASFGDSGEGPM